MLTGMPLSAKLDEQVKKLHEAAAKREAERIAAELGLSYLDAVQAPVKVDVLKLIPEEEAQTLEVAAFEFKKPILAVATVNPKNPAVQALVDRFAKQGVTVKLFVVSPRGLAHLLSFYKFAAPEKSGITSRVNIEEARVRELAATLTSRGKVEDAIHTFNFRAASVTEFLEIVLSGALANRASDIHLEPEERGVKLRYRVDGVLNDIVSDLDRAFYPSVISRVKLLSNLKLNVSDRPQDGRFTIGLTGKDVEIRVAIAPSEFGETMVLRVLDPEVINLSLRDLGFRDDDLAIVQAELARPNGMVLNTGPTGSGKTSTLYAFLKSKQTSEVKIVTIEDPIEYHLPGIEQTQVDPEAKYTFANGLRSIMRQDPDVILVGEVRDKETAEISIQAALTGHLVFSTVHANDAAGAIPRFLDLKVRASSIGPALNLVIAQRLVRRLCAQCRVLDESTVALSKVSEVVKNLPARVERAGIDAPTIFKPRGCDACGGTGYRGRVAIFELLEVPQELKDMITKEVGESQVERFAKSRGMVTMQEDGVVKAARGITSIAEVEDVTGPIEPRKG
jgi:type IV pilus assembly protein PilB